MIDDLTSQRREIGGARVVLCDRCHRRVTSMLYVPSRRSESGLDARAIRTVCADCWWAIELGEIIDMDNTKTDLVLTER